MAPILEVHSKWHNQNRRLHDTVLAPGETEMSSERAIRATWLPTRHGGDLADVRLPEHLTFRCLTRVRGYEESDL